MKSGAHSQPAGDTDHAGEDLQAVHYGGEVTRAWHVSKCTGRCQAGWVSARRPHPPRGLRHGLFSPEATKDMRPGRQTEQQVGQAQSSPPRLPPHAAVRPPRTRRAGQSVHSAWLRVEEERVP